MFKKITFIFLLIGFISLSFAQTNLNDYKYVVVPTKYDFLNEADKYQLNSLTKFLFEKQGFQTVMGNESFPNDLSQNRCLGLFSDVEKQSGMFKTKLKITLKDCNNLIIFESAIGETREKEYAKAYNLALRDAFKSFEGLNYVYTPNEKITSLATSETATKNEVSKEIQQLKDEIKNLKKEKVKVVKKESKVIVAEERPAVETITVTTATEEALSDILYAQEIENGFQLVDSSPKVVYRIIKTGINNVFLVENRSAIIYKKENNWLIEYYTGNTLIKETLNIKF